MTTIPAIVFPGQAGIQGKVNWILASAGMTNRVSSNLQSPRSTERGKIQYLSAFAVWLQFQDSYLAQAPQLLWQPGASGVHHQDSLVFLNDGVVGVAEYNDVDGSAKHRLKRRGKVTVRREMLG